MTLLLTPQFAATAHNILDATWIYYTSAERFIAMYPSVSCTEFFYSDELQAHEFFSLGTPKRNPNRTQFWTRAYIDEAGKGLMATIGAPVYDGDGRFRGTVAIDLTLQTLSKYMLGQELGDGRLLIVNPQGQVLADRSLLVGNIALAPRISDVLPGHDLEALVFGENGGFTAAHGELFASRPIEGTPWRLVYVTDQLALHTQAGSIPASRSPACRAVRRCVTARTLTGPAFSSPPPNGGRSSKASKPVSSTGWSRVFS